MQPGSQFRIGRTLEIAPKGDSTDEVGAENEPAEAPLRALSDGCLDNGRELRASWDRSVMIRVYDANCGTNDSAIGSGFRQKPRMAETVAIA